MTVAPPNTDQHDTDQHNTDQPSIQRLDGRLRDLLTG